MADMVRMKLTFWHGSKKPGDIVEVRSDEVRSWHGFAERLPDSEQPATEPSRDPDKQHTPATQKPPAVSTETKTAK
ncbi:hypothetical protein [Streptomyces sp. H27-D2]|uniref:hypothetical protein n=1 Tax=Streptomyces sp. H27-D2 TaxID=3046304 RepID=UPI002DBCC5DB|nr:hypothetical protein [Streptomyces sp. H27-D2]MEC4016097.1 hypothetical protein [Streptomyces sp. H27-D2]